MQTRKLAVDGAWEFTPDVYPDRRGLFVSPFQEPAFTAAVGRPFTVAQTNNNWSARGVVRGIHFTKTPPGQDKYVHCARGSALDFVVDLRVGSPTFGKWDAVRADTAAFRAVYFPVGCGHAFIALEDNTVMSYLVSSSYAPELELSIHPFDPELALPWPTELEHILSERDTSAPTLAQARADGLLPQYEDCLR